MGITGHDTEHQIRWPSAQAVTDLTEQDSSTLPEELLSVLLHDLRSPLGAVSVLVDLLMTPAEDGMPAASRQLQLLREASVKAQRMLDDAVEIQSVTRGSATLTPTVVTLENVVETCLGKAEQASYSKNVQFVYVPDEVERHQIKIDVEKAETAILCVLEQVSMHTKPPALLRIYHSTHDRLVNLHIVNEAAPTAQNDAKSLLAPEPTVSTLRGRLGNRRAGESRYSFKVTQKIMQLMGGRVVQRTDEWKHEIIMGFPVAAG